MAKVFEQTRRPEAVDLGAIRIAPENLSATATSDHSQSLRLTASETYIWRNRMPELGSYGSVGAGEGNLSLYPDILHFALFPHQKLGLSLASHLRLLISFL